MGKAVFGHYICRFHKKHQNKLILIIIDMIVSVTALDCVWKHKQGKRSGKGSDPENHLGYTRAGDTRLRRIISVMVGYLLGKIT
jgi:hypothetical protein